METLILGLFLLALLCSLLFRFSILIALLAGLLLFVFYALYRKHTVSDVVRMLIDGVKKARTILLTFLLIGVMTALWRACGTIAAIVTYSAGLLSPSILLLAVFLLNCLVSFLTGTSFGTGATMGVISCSAALSAGLSPLLTGGAVLSGCYFGDRCSPVSTSMLLTAELTGTDPHTNIRNMLGSAAVPFLLSCILFLVAGFLSKQEASVSGSVSVLASEFRITPLSLIPALLILLLSFFRVPVKLTMLCSILSAFFLAFFVQKCSLSELFTDMLFGFSAKNTEAAALINGGGILSMLRVGGIVLISSSFSGIFEKTGLLQGICEKIRAASLRIGPFGATLLTSVIASMASCNQTLSTILTHQLCHELCPEKERFAHWLENTVIVIAPLVPWSIAGSTILYACGLPLSGIGTAWYLFLIPLWSLLLSRRNKF